MIVIDMMAQVDGKTNDRARARCFASAVACLAACSPEGVSSETEGSTTEVSTTETPGTSTAPQTTAPGDSTDGSSGSTTAPVPACGNDLVEADEQCDGTDLAGASCMLLFGYEGELLCTETCTLETSGCVPPGMILIPGGEFEMGSDAFMDDERPARNVNVDTFYIDANEVTVAEYDLCVQTGSCELPGMGGYCNYGVAGRDDHPINCVGWFDAYTYCGWVGGRIDKRLPTEAEWEKAARGDDARIYPWGDDPPPTCTHVSMNEGMSGGCGADSSLPVGSKPMGDSPYGVHDMAGGVWDWVADWYGVYDVAEDDNPTGPPMGMFRVIRGGGWNTTDLNWFRTSARNPFDTAGNGNIGFRCAQDGALVME
jgi:sulfatase modifying factor 1